MLPTPSYRIIPARGPGKRMACERILAQWRGIEVAALENAKPTRTKPVSAIMPNVLKELGMDRRRVEAELVKVWNHLLDGNIVAHAQPTGFRNGTLFVTVDSSVWLSEIVRYRRKEILDCLRHSFGKEFIARISFRLG
jgi:predicted nucleic acid-binding Zn ribbon protein